MPHTNALHAAEDTCALRFIHQGEKNEIQAYINAKFMYAAFTLQAKVRSVEPSAVFLQAPAPECTEPRDKGLRRKKKRKRRGGPGDAALTCTSANSEGSQPACWFPSALNSPLTPFKKLICLGHLHKPRQTFAQDFRLSRLFLSLIIFPSFHTRVRRAPMKEPNSWSTEHQKKRMQQWRLWLVFLNVA